ncbi:PREDICTED: putative F-box protein At3g47150, partial [Camelina sativa]|uniref:F-box protein At3g47150 n=1 Tax=Camelina sativa TaxID=90675 RepID=A0ABM1RKY3_CAMSA
MKLCFRKHRRRFKQVSSPNPTPHYIPLDLQVETLLRLPVKSLLRFQCVSKLWSSIITSQDFRNRQLNFAASSAPRLLITFAKVYGKELLLFSLPYPTASSSSSSSCCVPYKDLSILKLHGRKVYNAARGLICVGTTQRVAICNPATWKVHVFPRIIFENIPRDGEPPSIYFLGYDPVGDQYKVLAVDRSRLRLKHQVVVLGGETVNWRAAPCVACPHVAKTWALYMNGTLYYGAIRTD